MRIGIDFRAMQIGHQLRGIGEVLRQACRQLDARLPVHDEIVAFADGPGPSIAALLGELFGADRRVVTVEMPPAGARLGRLRDTLSGAQAATVRRSCDALVQFDFLLGVPADHPTILVVHDQIPLELGDRYPQSYLPHYQAARRQGIAQREALERAARRRLYEHHLTNALTRAQHVVANSRHTAHTTAKFASAHGVEDLGRRLSVCLLGNGVAPADPPELTVMARERFEAYGLDRTPFLLYLGGVDDRRRVDLLVAAFNHLRADGTELKLVLGGDSFATVATIGIEQTRDAVASSSYQHDIHLLGFVDEAERSWLYRRAEAFVFPSEYEGFGLPVLEALAEGCTVVTFSNSSLRELAGPNTVVVRESWRSIIDGVVAARSRHDDQREADRRAGIEWAAGFTWDALGAELVDRLDVVRPGGARPADR